MKPVFSCSFDLAKESHTPAEVFAQAAETTREWIEKKYQRPINQYGFGHRINVPTPGKLEPLPGHLLLTEDAAVGLAKLRTIVWEHPGDQPNEFWRTEVSLAHDQSKAGITLHTSIGSRDYSLSPLNFQPGVPGLVRQFLATLTCTLGGWRMPGEFYPVHHREVERFVREFLLNRDRTLPVIVISRDLWSEKPLVQPEEWAKSLAGLAEVAVLEDKWAGFKLTEHLGRPLSCFGGAIRIYWPRLAPASAPEKHRLWLPEYVEAAERSTFPLRRRLVAFLSAISTSNHLESTLVATVREAVSRKKLDEFAATIARLKAADVSPETLEIVDAYSSENQELKAQLAQARTELAEERQVSASLRAEITNHQENYLALQQATPNAATIASAVNAATPPANFTSVLAAYDQAAKDFGGANSPLVFLDSARESAKESPYRSPEQVYFLIKELHGIATLWRDNNGKLGQDWRTALRDTGFDFKSRISDTTKGQFRSEYCFLYNGQKELFQEHVTKGAKDKNGCFSLHMFRDDTQLVVAIGHCGNHLSNTKS